MSWGSFGLAKTIRSQHAARRALIQETEKVEKLER